MLLKWANERETRDIFLFPKMKCKGLVLFSGLFLSSERRDEGILLQKF